MKYLIVTWPDRAPMLFTHEDNQFKHYDTQGNWDSNLEDWDTSNATIHEVTL